MGQPAGPAAQGVPLMRNSQHITSHLSSSPAFVCHRQRPSLPTASSAPAATLTGPVRRWQRLHCPSPVRRLSTLSMFTYGSSSDSAAMLTTLSGNRPLSVDSSATSSSGENFESQSKDTYSHGSSARLPSEDSQADYGKYFQGENLGVRPVAGQPGKIGSRRKGRGGPPRKTAQDEVEDRRQEPFLQSYLRRYRDEGHQALDDGETLLAKASNPYGLVLQIAEEANEYLRNNKEESLLRKPILKVISDRINEAYGEGLRDSYINEREDYPELED